MADTGLDRVLAALDASEQSIVEVQGWLIEEQGVRYANPKALLRKSKVVGIMIEGATKLLYEIGRDRRFVINQFVVDAGDGAIDALFELLKLESQVRAHIVSFGSGRLQDGPKMRDSEATLTQFCATALENLQRLRSLLETASGAPGQPTTEPPIAQASYTTQVDSTNNPTPPSRSP